MAVIKKTICQCGNEYIDFDNQIGKCPTCSDNQTVGDMQQSILKNLTYMDTSIVLGIVLKMLVLAKLDLININITPAVNTPEASGLCSYIRKLFRRM